MDLDKKEHLKKVALDYVNGKIFTDRHIKAAKDVFYVFMPLIFMSKEARTKLAESRPVLIYEHLEKAEPRSLNGMPIFMSCQFMNEEEFDYFSEYVQKYEKAIKDV